MLSIQAIILGIIQGIAEFLPISSSGHLVIVQSFFPNLAKSPIVLDIILHMGTLLALLVYYKKKLIQLLYDKTLLTKIIITSITTVLIVLPLKDYVELLFKQPIISCVMLIITGLILFLASNTHNNKYNHLSNKSAIMIGIAQAFAVIPGISRSGTTISTALFMKLKSSIATEFSFLIAIPIIFGAGILELRHVEHIDKQLFLPYSLGFIASFIFGLLSIKFLVNLLRKHSKMLRYFSYYLFSVGMLGILFFIIKQ